MKIVLFATPEFAIPTLELINNSNHEIVAVYTKMAKPQGRGMQLQNTPIYEKASKLGLKVAEMLYQQQLSIDDLPNSIFVKFRNPGDENILINYLQKKRLN